MKIVDFMHCPKVKCHKWPFFVHLLMNRSYRYLTGRARWREPVTQATLGALEARDVLRWGTTELCCVLTRITWPRQNSQTFFE